MLSLDHEFENSMEYDENLQPPSAQTASSGSTNKQGTNGPHRKINGIVVTDEQDTEQHIERKDHNEKKEHTPIPIEELNGIISNKQLSGIQMWKELILSILRNTLCYSLMPESGKVVVFDSTLPVKHAFRALAENDIKCAPVWHSKGQKGEDGEFIGFMTVTDFADILNYYAQDLTTFSRKLCELERTPVSRWCTFRKKHNQTEISRAFVYVTPDEPIFNAIHKMHQYFVHRMPVRNNESILCILNHQTILRFVWKQSEIYHHQLSIRVADLSQKHMKHPTMTKTQHVNDAVRILSQNRQCSAIPICEDDGTVIDAFLRSDIRFFARNQAYQKLGVAVSEFLHKFRTNLLVPKCTNNDNLLDVLHEMLSKRCHCALVLDEERKLVNIFNYYDVFTQIIHNQDMIKVEEDHTLNNDANDEDIILNDTDFLNDSMMKPN